MPKCGDYKKMIKIYFWIIISSVVCAVFSKYKYEDLSEEEKQDMQHQWNECCKTSKCINNSCYTVQWLSSSWATVRQRCQNQYPDWPSNVDIFRIQNEKSIYMFWDLLQRPTIPMKESPKSVWTTGVRCPKSNASGFTFETKWVSTRESFPAWLDKIISDDLKESRRKEGRCEFLVLYPAPNDTDVKYDFQDQNAHHPAICEFIFPGMEITTDSSESSESIYEVTTEHISQSTTIIVTETEETSSSHQSTTESKFTPSSWTLSSQKKTESVSSTKPTPSKEATTFIRRTTTNSPGFCEGKTESGIDWPDTPAGSTVRAKCPKGMIGLAEWECDEVSLQFQPEKPITEGCKHEWIDRLEDAIRNKDDAVEISTKLSKDTKQNNMSHGDIIALVNLTSSLLTLYAEQKEEEEFEVSQSEEIPVYYNFSKTMIASISNILRTEIKDAWEGLNETRQTREASTILKLVTTIGSRLSCFKTSDSKLQYTVSEENIDLQTFNLNNTSEEDVIIFPQTTEKVKASSSIVLPANLNLTKWFSACKTYSSAVGVIYKHVGDFLKAGQLNSNTTRVATKVLSFSLSNGTESIPLSDGKVNITLQHLLQQDIQYQTARNPRCVFWNFSKSISGDWDDSGCHLISFNETHTLCQCDHLTNFAVLMDINDNINDDDILTMMTYVCCGFSSFTLFLTLICFLSIRSLHGRRSIITGNLCFTLLITNVLIIFGLDKTQNKILCAVVAGVLHYWILAAFCWMLVEGYHLYRMVILVFQRGSNLSVKYYYLFAYGMPLIVVAVSAGIKSEGYGGAKYCWLSPEDGLMWSFVGPACAIILVNIVIFILTLRSASSVKIKREQTTIRKIKSWIRGSISVMCLLGLTWCIGLFYINRKLHFFSYVFTVLNGLQGAFIFLFHILLNDKVNSYCSCSSKDKTKKFGRRKFLNHTSSNPTNSKTSTRTSLNSIACTSSTKISDTPKKSIPSPPVRNYIPSNGQNGALDTVNHNHPNYRKNNVIRSVSGNVSRQQASPL